MLHSCLYYRMDRQLVSDAQFDSWAYELVDLQQKYPTDSESVGYELEAFRGFTGETGFDLPYNTPEMIAKAQRIYHYATERGKETATC